MSVGVKLDPVKLGDVFGCWTILRTSKKGVATTRVRCSCGNERTLHLSVLRNGGDERRCRHGEVIVTGSRFGRWTVLASQNNKRVKCQCECGTVRKVCATSLRQGQSLSCGCLAKERSAKAIFVNWSGHQHGDFKVSHRSPHKTRVYWVVQCVHCGRKKNLFAGCIKESLGIHCPCQVRERAKKNVSQFWTQTIKAYQGGARIRGLSWRLTDARVKQLMVLDCHYCGKKPSPRKCHWRAYCTVDVNGLDRVDSSRGYEGDNVVPCCSTCNIMKSNWSEREFIEHCGAVVRHKKDHDVVLKMLGR
jgi:hypothetical protein